MAQRPLDPRFPGCTGRNPERLPRCGGRGHRAEPKGRCCFPAGERSAARGDRRATELALPTPVEFAPPCAVPFFAREGAAKSPSTVINALKNITDSAPWGNSRNVNREIRACAGLDISRNPIRAPANLPERTGSRGGLLKNLLKVVRIISQSFGVQILLRMLSVRHVVAGPDGHRRRLVS